MRMMIRMIMRMAMRMIVRMLMRMRMRMRMTMRMIVRMLMRMLMRMIVRMIVTDGRATSDVHIPDDISDPSSSEQILLKSKQNAKFFDFLDENRLIFVFLSGRFQNVFRKKERFWILAFSCDRNNKAIVLPS